MIKYIFFILVLIISNSYSLEIQCKFEEVYSNSSVQNGFFLIKDQKLRYQYHSKDLFTIFQNDNKFYLLKNNDTSIVQKLNQNTELLKELMFILSRYPNLKTSYTFNDKNLMINLEKEVNGSFYKRISIKSEKINMSIYLNDCILAKIKDRFFSHNPYFEYKLN
tara:strand:- start:101 stop:592 length:492 start_codon:yes stop_codon:yes gene_type:complete